MSELHPATRGFAAADVYERGRPDYPPAAIALIVEKLGLRPGRTVLDLAAGTGKLTRLLVPSGANVLAVEPIREMRGELERRLRGVAALGQAFHWFKSAEALREIHRVLRPGGGVALVWNARDERNPLQAALSEIIDPLQGDTPRRKQRDWKTVLADSGFFERCDRKLFENAQVVDEQGLVDRVVSISFIAAAPPARRAEVEQRVRALVRDAEGPIVLPYMTEVYLGFKP
jgi:SAM-dependent methyltransferase